MPSWLKSISQVLVLVIAFFTIGLLTRMPALGFREFYALHGLLAAPFYSFLIAVYLRWAKAPIPLFVASCIYGCCLGAMQIVMGASVFIATFAAIIAVLIVRDRGSDIKAIVGACVYGSLAYPATLAAGFLFGSYSMSLSMGSAIQIAILALLGLALALITALLGSAIGKRGEMMLDQKREHIE